MIAACLPTLLASLRKSSFGPEDVIIPADKVHNLKDLMNIPDLGKKKFHYEGLVPLPHRDIQPGKSILSAIKRKI